MNRYSLDNIRPLRILLFATIILLSFCINSITTFASAGSEDFEDSLSIDNSKIIYSEHDEFISIVCLGEIVNTSDTSWDNVVIEVNFYDSTGGIVDTITESLYSSVVPAGGKITFRANGQAAQAKEKYTSHKARITWAEAKEKCSTSSNSKNLSIITKLLLSWGPMLLLISVWIFIMYWYYGKKRSPQQQSIHFLSQQVNLIEKQNQLFERLVKAIEEKPGDE